MQFAARARPLVGRALFVSPRGWRRAAKESLLLSNTKPMRAVELIDLLLEPDRYHDALISAARRRRPEPAAVVRVTEMLPLAIAQLDTVGDEYGALALEDLYTQLMRLHPQV